MSVVHSGAALGNASIAPEVGKNVAMEDGVGLGALEEEVETARLEIGVSRTSDEGLILGLGCCSIGVMTVVLG